MPLAEWVKLDEQGRIHLRCIDFVLNLFIDELFVYEQCQLVYRRGRFVCGWFTIGLLLTVLVGRLIIFHFLDSMSSDLFAIACK